MPTCNSSFGIAGLANATHEHGHVGALTSAVRMELVEDKESKPFGGIDETVVPRSA